MKKIIVRKEFYDALIHLGRSVADEGFASMANYIIKTYENGDWNTGYRQLIYNYHHEFKQVALGAEFVYKIATVYRNPKTGLIEVKEVS